MARKTNFDNCPYRDLLVQKLDFFIETMQEVRNDTKQIVKRNGKQDTRLARLYEKFDSNEKILKLHWKLIFALISINLGSITTAIILFLKLKT